MFSCLVVLIIMVVSWLINYYLSKRDLLHPSVMFFSGFLIASLMLLIEAKKFQIIICIDTIIILVLGNLGITIANIISIAANQKYNRTKKKIVVECIEVSRFFLYITLILQIISITTFVIYMRRLAIAYQGGVGSLPEMIKLYNNLTNFWTVAFANINVKIPVLYRICGPISDACAYIIVYITTNNYIVNKKIGKINIMVILLLMFEMLLNSSRSPVFRLVTMILIIYFVLLYKSGNMLRGDTRILFKLGKFVLIVVVGSFLLLGIIGRTLDVDIFHYLFIYTGAPIFNLNVLVNKGALYNSNGIWGWNTFGNLYRYIAKLFGITGLPSERSILANFVTSENGLATGNVYTQYSNFMMDFGYVGVFVLSFLEGLFFCMLYNKIMKKKYNNLLDYKLLIFSYLYNDIFMSFFSSRFYGTITDAPFIKMSVLTFLICKIEFSKKKVKIKLGNSFEVKL